MDIKVDTVSKTQDDVLAEIKNALKNIRWGSLEIYVQDSKVVQITERNIKKIPHSSSKVTHRSRFGSKKIILGKNGS